jgi:VWFA-related protein
MRKLLMIITILFTLPALAAKPVSTDQLEQFLESAHGKTDAEVARQIAELRLTERLSSARLVEMQKQLPGDRSIQALQALADESAFLSPSPSESTEKAAPDLPEQRRIMGLVVAYVRKAIPQLPNFLATRVTTRFEDKPQRGADFVNKYEPLHQVANHSAQVSYQDGRELLDTGAKSVKDQTPERGLTTWGEFGPILATVLLDAARSRLAWQRWEQGQSGPLAVFAYSVPRESSHYEVDYCCVSDSEGRTHVFHELEAYHGEMSVDPATGAILRLKVEAEIKAGEPVSRADLLVEYAKVEIGGGNYICPVHSIALSRARSLGQDDVEMVQASPRGAGGGASLTPVLVGTTADTTQQTLLNDVSYLQYHVFRAESRVLTEGAGDLLPLAGAPSGNTEPEVNTAPAAPPALNGTTAVAAPALPTGIAPTPVLRTSSAALPAPIEAAAELQPIADMSMEPATGLPDIPSAPQAASTQTGFTIRTTSRLVDVAVVAFDKKGQPVIDLKPGEIEIYDNGRKQQVTFFSQAGAGTALAPSTLPAQSPSTPDQPVYTNRAVPARNSRSEASSTVLLIDASNVAFGDLQYARQQMQLFFKGIPPDERVGLYILKHHGFEVLLEPTQDRARIASALAAWMPNAQDLERAQQEEQRNRQQMENVEHIRDLFYVNGSNPAGVSEANTSVDPQLRSLGDKPASEALAALPGLARHLAMITGHKSLIWVSSDNVLADWSERAPSNERGDKQIDPLALNAREALNEAHISIYPIDVSQLEAGGVGANLESANVQLSPTVDPRTQLAELAGSEKQEALEAYEKSQRNVNPGRLTGQMQQNSHPIQGTFRELAEATGGRALRRAGDIAAELNSIVADGRAAYLLSFTPETSADDKYHVLTVRVSRPGLTLRYRTGYLFSKEPDTIKGRFRQAVWQPQEMTEIDLTAFPEQDSSGKIVKLRIAGSDLALADRAGRWTDTIDIFLAQRNDDGTRATLSGRRIGLQMKPATYESAIREGIPVRQHIELGSETDSVRVIVVDENSGKMGSITVPASTLRSK